MIIAITLIIDIATIKDEDTVDYIETGFAGYAVCSIPSLFYISWKCNLSFNLALLFVFKL